jgi:hypothetical protein
VSTSPAAELARLKVTYRNWRITRTRRWLRCGRALDRAAHHCGHRGPAGDSVGRAVLRRVPAR